MVSEIDDLEKELSRLEREDKEESSSKWLPVFAILVALGSFAAIIWYAYNAGIRQGSETAAPILLAEGPIKIKPQDPGGLKVANADLNVMSRLSGEDTFIDENARLLPREASPDIASLAPLDTQESMQVGDDSKPDVMEKTTSEALGLQKRATKIHVSLPSSQGKSQAGETKTAKIKQSTASTLQAAGQELSLQDAQIDFANNWRIQIGAFRNVNAARSEWLRYKKLADGILDNLTSQFDKLDTKDRGTFYRARAGTLASRSAASALCAQLKQRQLNCIAIAPGK